MAITKKQIRDERGFLKKADDCSNCVSFSKPEHYNPGECLKDSFKVALSSWCKQHQRKDS